MSIRVQKVDHDRFDILWVDRTEFTKPIVVGKGLSIEAARRLLPTASEVRRDLRTERRQAALRRAG
jgi:hypothetical protein